MSKQRTPANIYEDGKDTGVSTTTLAWVEDPDNGEIVLAEGRAGSHELQYNQDVDEWWMVEKS